MTGKAARHKILVASRSAAFQDRMSEYSMHLAERLGYALVLLEIGAAGGAPTRPGFFSRWRCLPPAAAAKSLARFRQQAGRRHIHFEHLPCTQELGSAVETVCQERKGIAFILTDSDADKGEIAAIVSIPVFSVTFNSAPKTGGLRMATQVGTNRKKPVGRTIAFGLLTTAFYAAVFANTDLVMKYFTRGGVYAVLPIAAVFIFSFAHGAFASNLWSLLGIEARQKITAHKTVQPAARQVKRQDKRPRAYAYINPFHNISVTDKRSKTTIG